VEVADEFQIEIVVEVEEAPVVGETVTVTATEIRVRGLNQESVVDVKGRESGKETVTVIATGIPSKDGELDRDQTLHHDPVNVVTGDLEVIFGKRKKKSLK